MEKYTKEYTSLIILHLVFAELFLNIYFMLQSLGMFSSYIHVLC